jgi:hypothetical protein
MAKAAAQPPWTACSLLPLSAGNLVAVKHRAALILRVIPVSG